MKIVTTTIVEAKRSEELLELGKQLLGSAISEPVTDSMFSSLCRLAFPILYAEHVGSCCFIN